MKSFLYLLTVVAAINIGAASQQPLHLRRPLPATLLTISRRMRPGPPKTIAASAVTR